MYYELFHDDCFTWLQNRSENSIHAVVTDPPYGVKEYTSEELQKRNAGKGGIWRIPPTIGGSQRQPLPRFSVINDNASDREALYDFFREWASLVIPVLVPGAHVFIASTPLLSDIVSRALREAGFERRGELVRVVKTFRGGDRPKGAETEFPDISVIPRGQWEPWGIFRKPISEKTVSENLRRWGTGALRRPQTDVPFGDLILSEKTPDIEKRVAPHPSLKPQSLLRQIVRASLPLGQGIVLDTFAGSGSTLAACEFEGIKSIGVERDPEFYTLAQTAIPRLVNLYPRQTQLL